GYTDLTNILSLLESDVDISEALSVGSALSPTIPSCITQSSEEEDIDEFLNTKSGQAVTPTTKRNGKNFDFGGKNINFSSSVTNVKRIVRRRIKRFVKVKSGKARRSIMETKQQERYPVYEMT
ncbi:unnamed protein product, partial [Didymodactylos carnosus]